MEDGTKQLSGPELVIGLVGALGTDLSLVTKLLEEELKAVGYTIEIVRLTKQIQELDKWNGLPKSPRDIYIEKLQDAGDQIREDTGMGDAMVRLALPAIRKIRKEKNGESQKPYARCAFIVHQLKHPQEVSLLRKLYGPNFYLVAAYCPRDIRIHTLSQQISASHHSLRAEDFREPAERLMKRDEKDPENKFGQNVSDTFPLADVFFNIVGKEALQSSIRRFVDLVFGNPFITPLPDEAAMFHANAAALRSADLARQVGAVIATNKGDIIAVGTNEVPRAGGGLYWASDLPDERDFIFGKGKDQSRMMRLSALGEVFKHLQEQGWLKQEISGQSTDELINKATPFLRKTRLMGIGEFSRTVHAEMAALLDAARRGVPVESHALYTTTFPCHNCARHIVAAGICRVIYIAPYPKSLASDLHSDSIVIESSQPIRGKVMFEPFVGIAPRKYLDLFTMAERRGRDGHVLVWERYGSRPRHVEANAHIRYIEQESVLIKEFESKIPH